MKTYTNEILSQKIVIALGSDKFKKIVDFRLNSTTEISDVGRELLRNIPPFPGACAMMSSLYSKLLYDKYSIPSVVFAGDLIIQNKVMFKCKKNLEFNLGPNEISYLDWDGHCWVEIDGWIADISIFRTIYGFPKENTFRQFYESNFGKDKGLFLAKKNLLDAKIQYTPRFVLNENTIDGLVNGLWHKFQR